MSSYLEHMESDWRRRAPDLATWVMKNMVNRTDVWGRYLAKRQRKKGRDGRLNHAITAPFRDERGKVFLQESSLEKHFKAGDNGTVLGLHSVSADRTSRWLAIDVDLHDEEDHSVSAEGNFVAAHGWWMRLQELGFDSLLMDSNGAGGFHLLVLFALPMSSDIVYDFGSTLVADFAIRGLDTAPEIFPGKGILHHYGNWLRLPGRHHTKDHFTRIWNDEPGVDQKWLDGDDAIERILSTQPVSPAILAQHGIVPARKTVCIDFDGVIHSYRSPWAGEDVIPDPPIHGTGAAIARLRQYFRVVVHSARCRTEKGRTAIERWLKQYDIEVDDVCEHKPPAHVYVDDRAIPFTGSWDDAITAIHQFRR
ncbi:MAG: hypothetical protein QGG36_08770 [Pirellulaceae bacterium]|nr:hypothetical protein [Pirellulaceae bacterium]MDP7015879.1 hypothetical protein [Pirellulaceae bacterium]